MSIASYARPSHSRPAAIAIAIAGAWLGWVGAVAADIKLPAIIGDHMVLQQGAPAPIWGQADPGEAVTVSFAGQEARTVAGADGRWLVRLQPLRATPDAPGQSLTVAGKNTVTLRDVLIGETWLCSGQSNMQMPVSGCFDATQEIARAGLPKIRLFTVANQTAPRPQDDCQGQWVVCAPETVGSFSAAGYFFGRHLHQTLGLPIGLINSSWGGTIAEAWVSSAALRTNLPEFHSALDELDKPAATLAQELANYQAKKTVWDAASAEFYRMEEDRATVTNTAPDFDDHAWKPMTLPANWEAAGLPGLDGMVWFRKSVEIPAAWAGRDLMLRPGPIDEVDVTWFNGVVVGARGNSRTRDLKYWNQPREYRVPGNLVKAGRNVIAIRVSDANGEGGIWGTSAESMRVELADAPETQRLPLAGEWRYEVAFVLPPQPPNPNAPNRPSVLFNAMIQPLIPFAIRGAIWYQGESNASRAMQYRTLLPTLITDWRARFGVGDFPFLIVQLANFMPRSEQPEESAWAELREAQTLTTTRLPKVGQALAIDIGDAQDIHPRNKQEVGRRLGLIAETLAYDRQVASSGPRFTGMQVTTNGQAVLSFSHTDGGLQVKGEALTGFAICGADKKFVWAQARIMGEQVVVSAAAVPQPVAVRYAWGNNPACTLINGAGLPAVPFRTDRP